MMMIVGMLNYAALRMLIAADLHCITKKTFAM